MLVCAGPATSRKRRLGSTESWLRRLGLELQLQAKDSEALASAGAPDNGSAGPPPRAARFGILRRVLDFGLACRYWRPICFGMRGLHQRAIVCAHPARFCAQCGRVLFDHKSRGVPEVRSLLEAGSKLLFAGIVRFRINQAR